jgi:hypothetical protein
VRDAFGAALLGLVLLSGGISLSGARASAQTPAPGASPTAATETPIATASPIVSPTATPTPIYRFIYRATPAPNTTPFPGPGAPEIDEIDLSDSTLVPPADIYGRILTNPEVVKVTAETMGTELNIPQQSPGVFGLAASIPNVPNFLRNRSFDVTFTATVSDGRVASVTLPLTIK